MPGGVEAVVCCIFMNRLASHDIFGLLAASFDWKRTAMMLNEFIGSGKGERRACRRASGRGLL